METRKVIAFRLVKLKPSSLQLVESIPLIVGPVAEPGAGFASE